MNPTQRWYVAIALLVALVSGLAAAYLQPIGGSSEAREAHIIRAMHEQGNYILPNRHGILPSKPPLFHWIGVLVSQSGIGFTPFAARIPSVLASLLIIVCTAILVVRFAAFAGRSVSQDHSLILALFALMTNYGFERIRTLSMVDLVFSACVVGAMTAVLYGATTMKTAEDAWRPWPYMRHSLSSIFWICSGLSILAKGPAGVVLSVLLTFPLLASLVGFKNAAFFFVRPSMGWFLCALVALPWYILATLQGSSEFIGRQIIFENLQRITGNELMNSQPWWFYGPAFIRSAFPWSCIAIFVVARSVRDLFRRVAVTPQVRIERGLSFTLVLVLAIFSCADGKRESYLIPLAPIIALITGPLLARLIENAQEWSARRGRHVALGALVAIGFTVIVLQGLPLIVHIQAVEYISNWLVKDVWVFGAVWCLALSLFIVSVRAAVTDFHIRFGFALLSFTTIFSLSIGEGFAIRNRFKDLESISAEIRGRVGSQHLQIVRAPRDEFFDALMYYLNRELEIVSPELYPSNCKGFALLSSEEWVRIQSTPEVSSVKFIEIYQELGDIVSGRTRNQKVLLGCQYAN
jgi:4-amino-4-deoxy-L-arabinose transferase-like glycosyltransferase